MAAQFGRRTFFKGMVIAGASVLAACAHQPTPRGAKDPARPLPIPPLEEGTLDGNTRRFELTAQQGEFEIVAGTNTQTWGFNGAWLGPTLYMRRGEHIEMTVRNEVTEPTVVHWHGLHLPALADGGPALAFPPGGTWRPQWDVDQPAATCWYHPHPHEVSALHAYRGLAGGLIIADDDADALGLPSEYGVDDIPVIITDAKFTEDGQLDETIDPTYGLLGTTPLVNGITRPRFEATRRRLRLRIINGATMRYHHLTLGVPVQVIGTDQGLLESPVEADSILLSPGERAEVVVDLEPGKRLTLRSDGVPDDAGLQENAKEFGMRDHFDLLEIAAPGKDAPAPAGGLPQRLGASVDKQKAPVVEREFRLNGFQINEQSMDMDRIDFVVDHDGPELWRVTNENADWPHNFHIHNARFAVDGAPGWHDTIPIPPLQTVELYVEIGRYRDPRTPYMYHCHMLFHEDQGMMGQYVVA